MEMTESSPETIPPVAETKDVIPQIVSNVATEEITKAAEKIRREDSEKKKRKLKRKSISKKGSEMEKEMSVKQHMMSKEKSETKLRTQVTPFQLLKIAQFMEEQNIVEQVVAQRDFKEQTKVEERIKKADPKKRKSKSAKKNGYTSPKLALASEVTAVDVDQPNIVPRIPEETAEKPVITVEPKGEKKDSKKIKKKNDITSPKLTLASEVTAINVDQLDIVPPIAEETDEKPVITDIPKGEKKDSKKIKKKSKKRTKSKKTKKTEKDITAKEAASSQIKKKSKKRTKSKKTKKTEKDIAAKEAASSQIPETDITSPNLALASEVTATNVDQLDIVPPIAEETDKKPVITVEPKAEKKDSKKIKKKSKKRTKSKKTKETEKDIAAKEAASSQIPETDITSPNLALASEVTAINVDQLDIAPSIPEETDEKPVITDIPKGEKKDSEKIKKKSKKRTKSKKTKKTEKDRAAKEGATSQVTETDITSPKFTLASEDTAVDVDQQNIVPTIPEETVEKPLLKDEPKGEKKDSKKIMKKSKKRTKSKKTKKTEKDIAAKEAASSQETETDITSRKLALASEVTAINVDQLDIAPSIPEETDEKPVITDIPKGEKKDSEKIKKKSKKRTKSKKTKKTEKDTAAKEGATSQVKETDITSPKFTLASEDTAVDVDQQNIVPTIPEETVEKPLLRDEPKGEKKDSKKIKKKSKKRTKSKKTKKTEKDIAAKEAASSQETETDITSRKLALASEVTAINVDQLDIVPSIAKETDEKPVITVEPKAEKKDSKKIKKKSKKRTKSKKTKETEKDIAAKEAASSQIPETDITSPNLALASEVTAINVDQLDIAPSIA
ncbi:Zonadhesin [Trichinella spiralis]|uniref:Zonadhesin n=2 Tax=Trichinella spiralis TaxID=6334 RepID=A0ABR3KHX6_TRISP